MDVDVAAPMAVHPAKVEEAAFRRMLAAAEALLLVVVEVAGEQ